MRKKNPSTSTDVVTRRRFLEQLGMVGGSSLVMTAMNSWNLMAGSAQERPQLTGRPTKNKVIVLGAGVSGLVTAYELGKLGYDVRVIEARERVGGLNWSVRKGTEHQEIGSTDKQVCTFDEGLYVNVGPWRLPYTHTGVLGYCREVGVPVEIFVNEAENSYFYYEGAQYRRDGRQASSSPRSEGRHARSHQRAAGEGDRSEQARSPDDGGGQGPLRQVPDQRGIPRPVDEDLQGDRREWTSGVRHRQAAQGRHRQPLPLGAVDRRHAGRADLRTGRRHGPVPEGARARDWRPEDTRSARK
ncbi:MAG: FAD-dependent oxidoreductase [Vicinamibacterales bacterium]